MPGADSYPEGTTALTTDSEQRSLVKICSLIAAGGGGGGGGTTIQFLAASDPAGVPTGNAALAFRLDNGKMVVYNAGTASWDPYLG